ncbi:MAG: hypothetical protein HZC36_13960 [Armatimonadetes bacterium]|nr:hypothetical protein [Armatimonadota bacterium]
MLPVWSPNFSTPEMGWAPALKPEKWRSRLVRTAPVPKSPPSWPQQDVFEGGLTVLWKHKEAWIETRMAVFPDGKTQEVEVRVLRFTGGTEARFGTSILRCAALEIREDALAGVAIAEGEVVLADPDGELRCASFRFDWKARTGECERAGIRIGAMRAVCDQVRLYPDRWLLIGVRIDPDADGPKVYGLSAKQVELWPGSNGIAKRLGVSLFGKRVLILPRYGFSLRGGSEGVRLPGISRQESGEFGLTWDSDFVLSNRVSAFANAEFLQGGRPRTSLTFAYSLAELPRGQLTAIPRSSFADPFPFGFFDNVSVRNPLREFAATGLEHEVLYVSNAYRQRIAGREDLEYASKPLEIGFDFGRSSRMAAYRFQLRQERIQQEAHSEKGRWGLSGSLAVAPIDLGGGVSVLARLDGSMSDGVKGSYGWFRSLTGLQAEVAPWLKLGVGLSTTLESGTPAFSFDEPWPKRALHWRADFGLGPRKLSLLYKTDPRSGRVLDREIAFRQVAGSLEPYLVWREHPSRFVVGVELRTLDVLERIAKRLKSGKKGD